jgi:hypothetical protein
MIYVGAILILVVLIAVLGFWKILKLVDNFGQDWR